MTAIYDQVDDLLSGPLGGLGDVGPQSALDLETQKKKAAVDELFAADDGTEPVAPNIPLALEQNPDQAAKHQQVSRDTGVTPDAVAASPDVLEKEARRRQIETLLSGAPRTSEFLGNPENAAVSHDDVETLAAIEKLAQQGFSNDVGRVGTAGGQLVRGSTSVFTSIPKAVAVAGAQETKRLVDVFDQIDAGADIADVAAAEPPALRKLQPLLNNSTVMRYVQGTPEDRAAIRLGLVQADPRNNILYKAGEIADGAVKQTLPVNPKYAQEFFSGVVPQALGSGIAFLGAGALTGGLSVIPLGMASQGAQGFDEAIKKGASLEDAFRSFNLNAIVGTTEALPIISLLNKVDKGTGGSIKKLLVNMLKQGTEEAIQETFQKISGNLIASKIVKYDPTTGTFSGVAESGAAGFTVGALMAGLLGMVMPGRVRTDVSNASEAQQAKATLDALQAKLEQSKLAQRSPEKAAEHMAASLPEGTKISIPIEPLHDIVQSSGMDADSFYELLGVSGQVDEATLLGGDVTVDPQIFARYVMLNADLYSKMSDHVRLKEDGMTAAEAEEYQTSGMKNELDALSKEVDAEQPGIVSKIVSTVTGGKQADATASDTATTPAQQEVKIAEEEYALQGLFRTAQEAGMSEKEFQTYLEAKARGNDMSVNRQEQKHLRAIEREKTAEWKAERAKVEADVIESTRQKPVYEILNSMESQRFDRDALLAILPEGTSAESKAQLLQDLPKHRGRQIFTSNKGEAVDPALVAELYGYDGVDTMLFDIINSPSFDEAVQTETDRVMQEKHGELADERSRLSAAIESLHNHGQADLIAYELNWLRQAKKQGRLKPALARRAAQERMRDKKVSDIKPEKFLRAEKAYARKAGQLLRAGNRAGAADAKFRQLMNFLMAQEAYAAQDKIAKQEKYLRKFMRKRPPKAIRALPEDYLQAARDILSDYQLGPRLSDKKRANLMDWAEKKSNEQGIPVEIPQRILDADNKVHYADLTFDQWNELHDTVAGLHHQGIAENKFLKLGEARLLGEVVDTITPGVEQNLSDRSGELNETKWEHAKKFGREAMMLMLNADTILREVDGTLLGPAYQALKGGIDRAVSNGYQPGQKGLVARQKEAAGQMVEILKPFTKKERLNMTKRIDIPGVRARMSHQRVLAVLLNSGNADNIQALIDSKEFSEQEIKAVHEYASKKDWDFAQATWDFLDSFWGEIAAAQKRRTGHTPERVEAQAVETPHGTYKGGYYPLRYDTDRSFVGAIHDDLRAMSSPDELVKDMRFGRFAASHTKRGHTKERVGSGGHKLLLDLGVLNSHTQQVIYDLEMGDAVSDAYRVLHHADLKKAFIERGQKHRWEALDLWMQDTITGELHMQGPIEKAFRHLRTGFTVSKIGFNFGTVALQPLGILQSSVEIGKANTFRGLKALLAAPQFGENSIYKRVNEMSPMMAQREETYNREVQEAASLLRGSLAQRLTPGNSSEFVSNAAFYGIKKVQRFVDMWTWLGAHHQGMQKFDGDVGKATEWADRMVNRTQASGNFQERTPLERGRINRKVSQSDIVRAFVPLISYFMAKTNVAYERVQTSGLKSPLDIARHPVKALSLATDMAILYTVEAVIVAAMRGAFPDPEDDDKSLSGFVLNETMQSVAAGVPFVRDFVAEAEGFRGGGILSSVAMEFGKLITQLGQIETLDDLDAPLLKSASNLAGIFLHVPGTSQINKTGATLDRYLEGEEMEASEWIYGPQFNK